MTSGSFVAADNVREPDVYALLPPPWLTLGAVSSVRATPFAAAMMEARDDPAMMDATAHWPGFEEAERASSPWHRATPSTPTTSRSHTAIG